MRPGARALAEVVDAQQAELQLPALRVGVASAEVAWELNLPDPRELTNPGIPALADLQVPAPELPVAAGGPALPSDLAIPRILTPALAELAESPSLGELGELGWGGLLADDGDDGDEASLALGAALQGSAFGPFFGGGAGAGSGRGAGDGAESGATGEGGQGFGRGYLGQGAVPRKLHGIIVISNEAGAIPEAADVLTGNPVYTVYLEAPGFAKKWVLQVCVPAEQRENVAQNGDVIRVLSRKSLDPPFAFHKAPLGLDLTGRSPTELPPRIVVYANVTAAGELTDMRIIAGVDPATDNLVMANLQSWEFHPAFRDGHAVKVEALFGIPCVEPGCGKSRLFRAGCDILHLGPP